MGERQATRIFEYGEEAVAAIRTVQVHLRANWISEGCFDHQVWGCPSCQAIDLDRQLERLASEIIEDQDLPSPPTL